MKNRTPRAVVVLASLAALMGCQAEPFDEGVRVTPRSVTLQTLQQQAFAAAPTNVVWSIQQGAAGGTISASGLYTAPGSAGTFTIVALQPESGVSGQATVTVRQGSELLTHGMAIPPAHPRLWYNPARLAQARTWITSHPINPDMGSPDTDDRIEMATRGLLNNESSMCRSAIDWAAGATAGIPRTGTACDQCRWIGEAIILAYDWCHAFMTPAERSAFITATNSWVTHWRTQAWGGPAMTENNYHWGYTRNELMWAIASYDENVSVAETLLDDVFTTRLANNVYPDALAGGPWDGGVGREGTQYGFYTQWYVHIPWSSAWLLGRDVFTETNLWRESVYANIYSVSPGPSTGAGPNQQVNQGYTFFPHSDDETWLRTQGVEDDVGNFMAAVAMRWPDQPVGRHARRFLSMTGAQTSPYVQSVYPAGTDLAFTSLPLDYYGPGSGHVFGRTAWAATATTFHLQLKDGPETGHSHADWGNWQLWRSGRHLSRESVSYGENIVGWHGSGSVEADYAHGHNSLLIDGNGNRGDPWISGLADVLRLETQPGYFYAATDLSDTSENPAFVNWVREFVFVRSLETLVVLDRIQSSAANSTKTFLAHCETSPAISGTSATCTNGTQALVMRTLVPATSTYGVVTEGSEVGQYRIEVDTTPGTAQSYILTVLQAKATSAASLTPSVVDTGSAFVVTLDGSTELTFQKGMGSTGGSITLGASTTPFRTTVQGIDVTDAGPAWQ